MPSRLPLSTLLSQALVAFTIELDNEFERRFEDTGGGARVTSLTMWSNLLRFVGSGVTVGEFVSAVGLPRQQALSRLGGIERWWYVSVVGDGSTRKREGYGSARGTKDEWQVRYTPAGERAAPASKRVIRLTSAGENLQAADRRAHGRIGERWRKRPGTDVLDRVQETLDRLLDHPAIATGLTPYPGGWRASKPYVRHTEAVLADPRGRLPHHPMVLHRGGWPDGS